MAEVRVRALSLGRSPVPPDLPRGGTHLAGLEIFESAVAYDSLCPTPWFMLVFDENDRPARLSGHLRE